MGRRTLIGLVVCAAAVANISVSAGASDPVATASGKLPLLINNCNKAKVRPGNVILTCGDANFQTTGMNWSVWTQKSAVGTGTGAINDCDPNCVQGKTKTAPIQLSLSKPIKCSNGKRVFTKVRYTWTQNVPVKGPTTDAIPLGCKLFNI
jgi:hypothetical protein